MASTPNSEETDAILAVLRDFYRRHAIEYRLVRIGVFGSVARGEATHASDIDVVFETDAPNLFRTAHLRQVLEGELQRHVDVVRLRENMNPSLRRRIVQEAVYV